MIIPTFIFSGFLVTVGSVFMKCSKSKSKFSKTRSMLSTLLRTLSNLPKKKKFTKLVHINSLNKYVFLIFDSTLGLQINTLTTYSQIVEHYIQTTDASKTENKYSRH